MNFNSLDKMGIVASGFIEGGMSLSELVDILLTKREYTIRRICMVVTSALRAVFMKYEIGNLI